MGFILNQPVMTKNVSKARVSGNTNSSYKANRYDTKENWTTANPILNKGEIVIETDAGKARLKCGDGVNHYNDLEYIYAEGTGYTGDNVGDVTFSIAPTIPANKHELDGSQELRTDRTALWAWLEAHPEWLKTETEWQEIANANGGRCNYYSKGDEWSNFRYPKVIADQGRYLVELVGGAESDQPISENQYEFIMNTIGSLQGDVQAVENTINSGNVNSANYAKALTFTSIPKNANLNNYNTAGLYFNASTAETKTISNVPIGEAFFMLVFTTGNPNGRPTQVWFNYNGGGLYIRYYRDWSPEGWQPWQTLFSK